MNILVPNLGSTSLKYQLLSMPAGETLTRGKLERVSDYHDAIRRIPLDHPVEAVAFKAVLAGPDYCGTYLVDEGVLQAMERYLPAAPLHNAIYLAGIRAFRDSMPGIPLLAAFETEFHATMPEYAVRYGVPGYWREKHGIRRYGFHGASHCFVSERAPEILARPTAGLRLVSCHLGGSSSICAIQDGRSVDTSMGFSPQSGLEHATRHGDLDVFGVLYVMEKEGWGLDEVRSQLAKTGGLAGLSGVPGGDVRDLEAAAESGSEDARLALEVFAYQVRKSIGACAAAMGGIDAVAFTGGIGENSWRLREGCCQGLAFLGIELDRERNRNGRGDRLVSADSARAAVVALATNEELIVARRAWKVLAG